MKRRNFLSLLAAPAVIPLANLLPAPAIAEPVIEVATPVVWNVGRRVFFSNAGVAEASVWSYDLAASLWSDDLKQEVRDNIMPLRQLVHDYGKEFGDDRQI